MFSRFLKKENSTLWLRALLVTGASSETVAVLFSPFNQSITALEGHTWPLVRWGQVVLLFSLSCSASGEYYMHYDRSMICFRPPGQWSCSTHGKKSGAHV